MSINIDEARQHVLTSITKTGNGTKRHESDHNSILTKFNLTWEAKENKPKVEVFNFNNKEGQRMFKDITSDNTKLSEIFDTSEDINTQTKRFIKTLDGMLHRCFKKS